MDMDGSESRRLRISAVYVKESSFERTEDNQGVYEGDVLNSNSSDFNNDKK